MLQIDLTSSWVLRTVAIIIGLYGIFALFRTLQNTYYPKPIKIALSVLRSLALIIFILIILNIKFTFTYDKQVQSDIAFLWDDSKSMARLDSTYHPGGILRSDAYRKLKKQVHIEHIANMMEPRIMSEANVLNMPLDKKISNNGNLLRYAEKSIKYSELILISDGRSYLGEDLEDIKLKEGIKVHTVEVGHVEENVYPILRSVRTPDYVKDGDSIKVSWVLQNTGNEDISTNLKILRGNKEVYIETVNIPAERLIRSEHMFAPANEGTLELSWYVDNNENIGTETILIHPSKIRILCHADPPDRDIAMVYAILSKTDNIEIYNLEEWKKDFPQDKPDLSIQTWDHGKTDLIFPDIPAVLFYRDNHYDSFNVFEIVLTKPYIAFSPDPGLNSFYWTQLPPIQMTELKFKGKVVLENNLGWPFILEQAEKQKIIINGSGLWRWNLAGYEKDWDGLYEHVIYGMIDYIIKQRNQTYISLDERIYNGIEYQNLQIETQLFNLNSVDQNESFVRVTLLDSTFEELRRYEHDLNESTGNFQINEKGTYHIKADLFSHDNILESDTAFVVIEKNDLENTSFQFNPNALSDLAVKHNGTYQHYTDPDSLSFRISTEKKWERVTNIIKARSTYWLYALMFLLLCADWILRKRHGGM